MPPPIYLDHAATTPLDERVLDAMDPYLRGQFGNAASSQHPWGQAANAAVERARAQVANTLGADPREVVFTSGATESNNLALLGLAGSPAHGHRRHIITVRTEHRAVLDPCRHLESQGYDVTWLPVNDRGLVDVGQLRDALRTDTLVVSVMHGNNETGVVQPVADIAAACREREVFLHSDATQAFGKMPLGDDTAPYADLISVSAHKLHGPQGVGALFVRRRAPRVRLAPLLHGGGHERGLRSGTVAVPNVVGMGAAAELAHPNRDHGAFLCALRNRLEAGLLDRIDGAHVHGAGPQGSGAPRLPHITNLAIPGTDARHLMAMLPSLGMATASACSSTTARPSHVLGAMGIPPEVIAGSVRLSVGRSTTNGEIDQAVDWIAAAVPSERARHATAPAPDRC